MNRDIPLVEVSKELGADSVRMFRHEARTFGFLVKGRVPDVIVKSLDAVSRNFLVRSNQPHLAEIDEVARVLGMPGAYFLNVMFEWGCTVKVHDTPRGPELVRVLDWSTKGLGHNAKLFRVPGEQGPWYTLSWAGFVGIVQGLAPRRFAAAINQAPLTRHTGFFYPDWMIERVRTWRSQGMLPAHLLRKVMDEAKDYEQAREMLMHTPVCVPVIYSLVGTKRGEKAIIEKVRGASGCYDGPCAANHFNRQPAGHDRGAHSFWRSHCLHQAECDPKDRHFTWLREPVLNTETLLAFIANPSEGSLTAAGYEDMRRVTSTLKFKG